MGCLLITASVKNSSGQTISPDSAQQIAYNKIVATFYKQIEPEKLLYNGRGYLYHPNSIRGDAYFTDDKTLHNGTVVYDSIYYNNVSLMYDVYADVVAVLMPNKYSMVMLHNSRLLAFTVDEHKFVNLPADEDKVIKAGNHEVLYDGKVQAFGKYSKSLQSAYSTSGAPEQFFKGSKSFYLKKNGKYYVAGSESAVLKVFEDKKKELKQFIKTKQIKFRRNPEQALALIAAEYDRLINAI